MFQARALGSYTPSPGLSGPLPGLCENPWGEQHTFTVTIGGSGGSARATSEGEPSVTPGLAWPVVLEQMEEPKENSHVVSSLSPHICDGGRRCCLLTGKFLSHVKG